jgi:hypothetical protein
MPSRASTPRRVLYRTSGIVLLVFGYLILLLPGPLGWPGIPPMVVGALLILRSSQGAKRWFVSAAKEQPATFGRLRRWIAEQRVKRWRKRAA